MMERLRKEEDAARAVREMLRHFADLSEIELAEAGEEEDDLRSLNNPLVYLFLGDSSAGLLKRVAEANRRRWRNSGGVGYLYVGADNGELPEGDQLYRWQPAAAGESGDKRTVRPELKRRMYRDDDKLLELNVTLRRMNARISEFGRMYANLQRLHVSVVVRADDPYSVLLPELTVLMKAVFGESFRSVLTDAYVLLSERQTEADYAYRASLGVALLKELDRCQAKTYRFQAELQRTGDGIRLPVAHPPSPLFDTVYLLSDKDERGLFAGDPEQLFCEIVSGLSLLKNRKRPEETDPEAGSYHHQLFKQGIASPDGETPTYASAGHAKVSRPNAAIALNVLYRTYKHVLERMQQRSEEGAREAAALLELDAGQWDRQLRAVLPEREQALDAMRGLMHGPAPLAELRTMSLRQAEAALYGGHAADFFAAQIARPAAAALEKRDAPGKLERLLEGRVVGDPLHGFYSAYVWTAGGDAGALRQGLQAQLRQTTGLLEQGREELERLLDEPVAARPYARGSLLSWLKPAAPVRQLARELLGEIYGLRYELLELELKQRLLAGCLRKLEELHERVKPFAERLIRLEQTLKEASRAGISSLQEEAGRNIDEYYGQVVSALMEQLESRRGERFLFTEQGLGNVSMLIAQGEAALLAKLAELVRRELFGHPLFRRSFEDELLERANVSAGYESRDLLSKEQLFRDLYETLEQEAAVRIDVYGMTHRHRYDEKYFIGDERSEFIRYAFAVDHGSRTYKLGCVHERMKSGIEKLNVTGGFRISDTMYYRNGLKYYEMYCRNGYEFHDRSGQEGDAGETA